MGLTSSNPSLASRRTGSTSNVNNYDSIDNGDLRQRQQSQQLPSVTESDYEELIPNAMTCPTCKGLGRISRNQENELVAIIPLSDQRLKPRRTWLVVILTIFICAIIAGLLLFFIFPRQIDVESIETDHVIAATNVTLEKFPDRFDPKYRLNVTFTETLVLTNANYFMVSISRVELDANHIVPGGDSKLILFPLVHYANNTTIDHVSVRSSSNFSFELKISLDTRKDKDGDLNWYVMQDCLYPHSPQFRDIAMVMNVTVYYEYLGNTQHQGLTYNRRIDCDPDEFTTTTSTTTSTTTTTTTTTTTKPPPKAIIIGPNSLTDTSPLATLID